MYVGELWFKFLLFIGKIYKELMGKLERKKTTVGILNENNMVFLK